MNHSISSKSAARTFRYAFWTTSFLLILDSSVGGYIHMISPVKSGGKNSNITYFDMMIQTLDVNYRGV